MNKKRCPCCGSSEIATIVWGLVESSDELVQGLDLGKYVLGGCCISSNDPKYHCNTCQTDFGRNFDIRFLDMCEVKLTISCFTSSDMIVRVSNKSGNLSITYQPQGTPGEKKHYTRDLDLLDWMTFIEAMRSCYVLEWKKRYDASDILDGLQWKLYIKFSDKKSFTSSGSNDYPPQWRKLLKSFQKLLIFQETQFIIL